MWDIYLSIRVEYSLDVFYPVLLTLKSQGLTQSLEPTSNQQASEVLLSPLVPPPTTISAGVRDVYHHICLFVKMWM